mgnify:CR=1 FL=1
MDNPLLLPPGTQVVTRNDVPQTEGRPGHPKGSVGIITKLPVDADHAYCVRFPDGNQAFLKRDELAIRKLVHRQALEEAASLLEEYDLYQHVIYRCVMGSRAYGLNVDGSDTDRRGVYLPPADMQWSLFGVPEQLESKDTEECYWELQKFIVLALKNNPNILECLYSPIVETVTEIGQKLLDIKGIFLSKMIYQTYNGYAMSQFKKMEGDLRNNGEIKLKHAMHLIRLLLCGLTALKEHRIPVDVEEHRSDLLAIRNGEIPWEDINNWRLKLHADFEKAYKQTSLPERPNYEAANTFLIQARRSVI